MLLLETKTYETVECRSRVSWILLGITLWIFRDKFSSGKIWKVFALMKSREVVQQCCNNAWKLKNEFRKLGTLLGVWNEGSFVNIFLSNFVQNFIFVTFQCSWKVLNDTEASTQTPCYAPSGHFHLVFAAALWKALLVAHNIQMSQLVPICIAGIIPRAIWAYLAKNLCILSLHR